MAKKTVKKAVKKPIAATKKPTVAAKKPAPAAKKPPVVVKKPVPAAKKPPVVVKKPVPVAKKPPVVVKKPVPVAKKPPVVVKKPVPVAKKPPVTVEKPVVAEKKPVIVTQQPSAEKKTTEKKTSVSDKRLTAAEIGVFKEKLLALRARLCGNIGTMTDAALNKNRMEASGEISSAPIHMADVGSDNFEQEQTLTFVQSESELLDFIDDALERVKDGTYGICEGCECLIPKGRLNIIPYASMCVKCAEVAQQNEW